MLALPRPRGVVSRDDNGRCVPACDLRASSYASLLPGKLLSSPGKHLFALHDGRQAALLQLPEGLV